MKDLRLEVLTATHAVAVCVTGDAPIDDYLHRAALSEQSQGMATVYVAVDAADAVVGFFTLSPISLRVDSQVEELLAARNAPYPQFGGYLLGRMGVDSRRQRVGLGAALIAKVVEIARAQRSVTGGMFLAVDPKTLELAAWYERLGFTMIDVLRKRHRMILPLS